MQRFCVIVSVCMALAGCASNGLQQAAGEPLAPGALERSGSWQKAFIGYRSVLAEAADEATADAARLGAARCLIAMGHHHAALAMLDPLPEDASTETDRRRLALAAEAMLRLGVWVHAESLAEVALSGRAPGEESDSWAAACSANLAKAYLENGKPARAAAMYRSASGLFQSTNQRQAARECLALALEIETAIGRAANGDRYGSAPEESSGAGAP